MKIDKGGRPSKYKETVDKLERAFEEGANISEACSVAGIDRQTYYNWIKRHKSFSSKMEKSRNWVTEVARANIARSIVKKKDTELSKWWLERKNKNEFSLRTQTEVTFNDDGFNDEQIDKIARRRVERRGDSTGDTSSEE